MQRHPVSSTNIDSVGYDAVGQVLEIEFKTWGVYQYFGLPPAVYEGLLRASSKGRYFQQHIRDRFKTRQVG